MRRYLRPLLVAVLLPLPGCNKSDHAAGNAPGWELKPPAADSTPVTAKEKMPGLYPAGSRIEDEQALGGFGPCDNYPKDIGVKNWGTKGAVSLIAFPGEPVAYFKHRGFALRLINRTGEAMAFTACDSTLMIVQEAQDAGGAWRAVEAPPEPICGNSVHRVFLGPGQYWEFPAREYSGPTKTTLRFRLYPGGGRRTIYSNEFTGHVTAAQFDGG